MTAPRRASGAVRGGAAVALVLVLGGQASIESTPIAPLAPQTAPLPLTPGGVLAPRPAPSEAPAPDTGGAAPATGDAAFLPLGAPPPGPPGLNPLVVAEPLPSDDTAPTDPAAPAPGAPTTLPGADPAVPGAVAAAPPATRTDPRFRRAPPGLAPGAGGGQETPGLAPEGPAGGTEAPAEVAPQLIPPIETELSQGASLRQLDKLSGRIATLEVPAGGERVQDRLRLRVLGCRAPDDNGSRGTMAFLQIWDIRHDDGAPAFSGWMFAESPALSALDHPRYDVWVVGCTGRAAPAAPTPTEAPPIPAEDAPLDDTALD